MLRRHAIRLGLAISGAILLGADLAIAEAPSIDAKTAQRPWPDAPEAVSSFGAAICDGWLYVYGGHVGGAHEHSRENLSKQFLRLNLASPSAWESLPMQTPLQGLPLATDGRYVYRVGGLQALNEKGQPDQLVSLAEVERFDPATKQWSKLPSLPEGRSSHDAVVIDRTLYVIGGWTLGGDDQNWVDRGYKLRLDQPQATWEPVAQDFRRRALSIAAAGGKLYAIGGMTAESKPSNDVRVMDLASETWSQGPALPLEPINGFGCSAATLGDRLYVSTMDGSVLRLAENGSAWETVASLKQPRFFHRMLPLDNHTLLVVAGASMQVGHLKSLESVAIDP